MSPIVKRIVLAFVGLYILGLIIEPNVFFPGLGVLLILSPFAGLFWLVFRRCKFTMGQLMASLFLFGAAMSAATNIDSARESGAILAFAIVMIPLIGVGMFLGARAAMKSEPKNQLRRWRFFLAGLFLPCSSIGLVALLSRINDPEWQFAVAMDFTVFVLSLYTIVRCISMKSEQMREPDRIVPKICPDRV